MNNEWGVNRDGEQVIHDEYGTAWAVDSDGNRRVPMQAEPIQDGSGFTHYDSSRGHCGLCGRLTCNGGCFK
jgi:hypothetical protein